MAKKKEVVSEEIRKENQFEDVKLLMTRALELREGAKPLIDLSDYKKPILDSDYYKIAKMEYEQGKIDLELVKD